MEVKSKLGFKIQEPEWLGSAVHMLFHVTVIASFETIVGDVRGVKNRQTEECSLRAGIGMKFSKSNHSTEGTKEHRKQIVDQIDHCHEEGYTTKAVGQYVQGVWLNWKEYINRNIYLGDPSCPLS